MNRLFAIPIAVVSLITGMALGMLLLWGQLQSENYAVIDLREVETERGLNE